MITPEFTSFLRERKEDLQSNIEILIAEFEKNTGLQVTSLRDECSRVNDYASGEVFSSVHHVKVTVEV